jgi:hypothetical protein
MSPHGKGAPWKGPNPESVSRANGRRSESIEDERQLDIFSAIDEGRRRRDDGMRAALHNTDVRWRSAADQAIRDLAATGLEFTAEHVRERVGVIAAPPQALGAVFNAARRAGIIVPVGYATATRPERHGGLLRTWRGAP